MRTIEPWKAWVFIGSLAIVAFVINSSVRQRQSVQIAQDRQIAIQQDEQRALAEREKAEAAATRKRAEEQAAEARKVAEEQAIEARKAAEEAAADHAKFLARYLNKALGRHPGIQKVAILASSEDRQLNLAISDALTERFKTGAVVVVSSLFRSEFVSDGLADDLFHGSSEVFSKLELTNALDVLVLARQEVRYSKNPSLENVTTANMRLEVATFFVATNMKDHTWTFEVNGAGFTDTAARSMAEERLLKEIAKDTKLSLPH